MKTHEIGVMNFNLKRGSGLSLQPRLKEPRPGPTKLSIALSAEWGHRGR